MILIHALYTPATSMIARGVGDIDSVIDSTLDYLTEDDHRSHRYLIHAILENVRNSYQRQHSP